MTKTYNLSFKFHGSKTWCLELVGRKFYLRVRNVSSLTRPEFMNESSFMFTHDWGFGMCLKRVMGGCKVKYYFIKFIRFIPTHESEGTTSSDHTSFRNSVNKEINKASDLGIVGSTMSVVYFIYDEIL